MWQAVRNLFYRFNPYFVVKVTHGNGMFTAECDALHLATEAVTFEALTERVWQVAPDIAEANSMKLNPDSMRLSFRVVQAASCHRFAV